MKKLSVNREKDAIKEFISGLPLEDDGVQLELDGKIICQVLPPEAFTEADKDALIQRGRQLVAQARQRNKGVPARAIEREVRDAVNQVRHRKT